MDSSAQLRSKHLDMQFMRRRRQRNLAGASRQWFVNADLWLAGTAAAAVGEGQVKLEPQVRYSISEAHTYLGQCPLCQVATGSASFSVRAVAMAKGQMALHSSKC